MKDSIEIKNSKLGKVWLVGAGPGDVGLLTIKGKDLIKTADVVVYDSLVGSSILVLIPKNVEKINVGKVAGNHPVPQEEINQILLREALAGKKVIRLKGGDPFLFGRGGEELELLRANKIPFEIVPGITSAIAVPAYHGIPVTHRDFCSSVHVITGHTKKQSEPDIDYTSLVKLGGTLVFLMGVMAMGAICKGLMDAGMSKDMPVAILERGTTAHQRRIISSLEHLTEKAEKEKIVTPSIIVVGEVCKLAKEFHWAEDRLLGEMKILVTRPKDRDSDLAGALRFHGAEVLEIPTIETDVILDADLIVQTLESIGVFQWIGFTSPYGVKVFFDKLKELSIDIRSLNGIRFAAIGPATKQAIEEKGIFVDLMPEVYDGKSLGIALKQIITEGQLEETRNPVVLLPRAKIGTEEVLKPLEESGILFEDLPIYDTIEAPQTDLKFEDEAVDYVAFTSGSTVRGFVKMFEDIDFSKVKAVCIGDQTASEAQKNGMQVVISEKATIDSMVECIINLANSKDWTKG